MTARETMSGGFAVRDLDELAARARAGGTEGTDALLREIRPLVYRWAWMKTADRANREFTDPGSCLAHCRDAARTPARRVRSGGPAGFTPAEAADMLESNATTPHPIGSSGDPGSAPDRQRTPTGRLSRSVLATLGAAAAAITLLVLADPEPDVSPGAVAPADEPMTASLNVSSSRPFAFFPTDNPDLAIVWLFDEEER